MLPELFTGRIGEGILGVIEDKGRGQGRLPDRDIPTRHSHWAPKGLQMTVFAKNGGPPGLSKIALLGTYTPRQCGIATFTADLRSGMSQVNPGAIFDVVAVSDVKGAYSYPSEVCLEIDQHEVDSYRAAADFLNANGYEALCVQHEFGIFGGPAGDMLIDLLRRVEMPVFVTLHTILANPNPDQRRVIEELCKLSSTITVISHKGAELLRSVYGIPDSMIEQIHHGVPGPTGSKGNSAARAVVPEGGRVLLTFGLISPDKGLENVIQAMPKILEKVPDATYLVVGATHPHVRAHHGEAYRESLIKLAADLGVGEHVRFLNRFVELSELTEFLALADLYITPYLKEEQISSGTLAYAVGSGRATISTPYWYASELLADGRGSLVPFRDPEAIATAAVGLLLDDSARHEMEAKALDLGRQMRWSEVSGAYLDLLEMAVRLHFGSRRVVVKTGMDWRKLVAPSYNLAHLKRMTDDTGLLQHAKYTIPNFDEGYSIDDNVRALMLAAHLLASKAVSSEEGEGLLTRYLGFVNHSYNRDLRRFRNFMSYDRRWLEAHGSEDSHGRAMWALGFVRAILPGTSYEALSTELFDDALPGAMKLNSPRTMAYTLLGICELLKANPESSVKRQGSELANRLFDRLKISRRPGWLWFEEVLAYCNARMPQALIRAGYCLGRQDHVDAGLKSLDWLCQVQTSTEGYFEPVGSSRVFHRGEGKPRFDQQPVEAHATMSACITAWEVTGDEIWPQRARLAFEWFQGFNHLRRLVCDPSTGGCRDGLKEDRLNENEGAESTLSWMLSIAEMRAAGLAETCPEELPAYLS